MSEGPLRALTLAGAVEAWARRSPSRIALQLEDGALSYEELRANAEGWARKIVALGARRGDHVGVLLPNCLCYIEIVLGAAMVGVVLVPMNTRFKARELKHLICDSGMVALFTQREIVDVVDFAVLLGEALPGLSDAADWRRLSLPDAPALRSILLLHEDGALEAFEGELPAGPGPQDTLLLMYTSGTTASPKGCIVPNRALLSNAWAIVDRFELVPDDAWWCPLPMFHIGGLLFPTMMFAAGGTYLGMTHFAADAAIDMMRRHAPTIFYPLFPTITLALTEHPRFAEVDFSRLRMLCSVAPETVQRKLQAAVPNAPLMGAFGMTEACGTVAYGSYADSEAQRLGTCGRPLPGWQMKILDAETRAEIAVGQRGEIAIRGEGLFAGYWNDADLTRRQHLPDGFFLTGDVGSIDADGFLSFHGRFKDQLKVGGENVSALEVESFLASHPAIHLAQVVGIDDAKYGEVPAAFIELKGGYSLAEADVLQFCEGRIARFKVPRHVRFVTEWPMSATKVVKFRLKERLDAELAAAD